MFRSGALAKLAVLSFIAALACAAPAAAGPDTPKPPADLANLEREVSLKIAHVRDEGPTDPVQRQKLHDAELLDATAEQQISTGDFRSAEDNLVKANAIASELAH
jgi:hypothetical protein